MSKVSRLVRLGGVVCIGLLATGCSVLKGPAPWEKGLLAKPSMAMGGDALDQRFTQHIYASKETAAGGYGVGGGGCGCN